MNKNKNFISGPELPFMTEQHSDSRRTIREVEINQPGSPMRRLTHLIIGKPENGDMIELGNHVHGREESFAVISGKPTLTTVEVDNPENIVERQLKPGDTFIIPAKTAHTFTFGEDGELRSSMEGTFRESQTHSYKINQ